MVYRNVDEAAHLSYQGQSSLNYIPVDEDVELNLGAVGNVTVEPTLMDFKTDQYLFHNNGNITGWDEIRTFKVEVKHTREVAVKVQIDRNFKSQHWKLTREGDLGEYEKIDLDTVRFTLDLPARSKKKFRYVLTTRHGSRENR